MGTKIRLIRLGIVASAALTIIATSRVESARDYVSLNFESGYKICACYEIGESPSTKSHYATNGSDYPIEITIGLRTNGGEQVRLVLTPKSKTLLGCTEEKSKYGKCVRTYRSLDDAQYVWTDGTKSPHPQMPSR